MDKHIISNKATLIDALRQLNELSGQGPMTLVVIDSNRKLLGTLTDGDVRRALISGQEIRGNVTGAMRKNFRALPPDIDQVRELKKFRRLGIKLVPVVDADGRLDHIINLTLKATILPLSAIVMAGGKGERLRPLTLERPKPLLPVGGKAIIDHNIALLAAAGINDVTVTTNYLAQQLEDHFSKPVEGISVKCVRESQPLGTLGAASLVNHPDGGKTLVMNSDLFTTLSLEEMYLRHCDQQADITIAALPYNVSVPYAILSLSNDYVTALEEKPSYAYYANAGIYIINNHLLKSMVPGQKIDAPDFITQAIKQGKKVAYYPINGSWIDIGTPQDYKHAQQVAAHL